MKLSLVLLAGLAAAACLRSRSAALRHWIVAAAIICAAATPFIETIVPAWPVYVAATPDVPHVLVTVGDSAAETVAPAWPFTSLSSVEADTSVLPAASSMIWA